MYSSILFKYNIKELCMRAPRCPQVHKSSSDWELWIDKYMDHKTTYLPQHLRRFDIYKTSNSFFINSSHSILLNNWKYIVYEWLTGRKHHILSFK